MRISEYISKLANNIQEEKGIICTITHLPNDTECACIRVMPSSNTRFYDETYKSINLSFQLLVKSNKQSRTARLTEEISEYIESLGADIYTEPNPLSFDEQGYIYTASFNTEI